MSFPLKNELPHDSGMTIFQKKSNATPEHLAVSSHTDEMERLFQELSNTIDDVEEVIERFMDLMSHYKKRIFILEAGNAELTTVPMSQAEIKVLQVMYKLRLQVDALYRKHPSR